MTNSALLGLKLTIIGAAFFLGGCLLSNQTIGLLFFVAGPLVMLVGAFAGNANPAPEKKDEAQPNPNPNPNPTEEKK